MSEFSPVYGPVQSWRYGHSLGIDPIGLVSTCSFNCVYCQLGQIERLSSQRQTFIPTGAILAALDQKLEKDLDVITLSGSGEPTLALNLGEIIAQVKAKTIVPIVVLTNGTLLDSESVRSDLCLADEVSVKLDAVTPEGVKRVNRPGFAWDGQIFWQSLLSFRAQFAGRLTIQTMLLSAWSEVEKQIYIECLQELRPDRVYLNIPRRPKPLRRLLQGRENLTAVENSAWLKPLSVEYLEDFAHAIKEQSQLPVSYAVATMPESLERPPER
ncbi:MAG: radical SAM protein [Pseudanabaenaceae cyanobacterium SKYGB_i_bin29]|nr:radical SAM protein [Pseudanabaenaceae cyanobacterium SKYG29]MDW8421050.1 radical SAM protein [Pseudanabaenaceae cyanobacterium SKYGB_i_bin29]